MKHHWKTTIIGGLKLVVAAGLIANAALNGDHASLLAGIAGIGQLLSSAGFFATADASNIKDSAQK